MLIWGIDMGKTGAEFGEFNAQPGAPLERATWMKKKWQIEVMGIHASAF
jgi:hypothetical protein